MWLTDEQVQSIRLEPGPTSVFPFVLTVVAPEELSLLRDFLLLGGWAHLRYYADCFASGSGGAFDEAGFRFGSDRDDLDPGEAPFDGVNVFVPWGELYLSRAAFDQLMGRYFRALVDGARTQRHPITAEPWWSAFEISVASSASSRG